MIPCTHFIPAYSELFKYLEDRGGPEAVRDFWCYLSDNFLGNLLQKYCHKPDIHTILFLLDPLNF